MPKPNNSNKKTGNQSRSLKHKPEEADSKIEVPVITKKEPQVEDEVTEVKNEAESSFAEFTKRPLPNEDEVKKFDDYVENESKEDSVNSSLSEIYQDDNGNMVDVDKLDIKKRGFFSWFLTTILTLFIVSAMVFLVYNYIYLPSLTDSTAVELSIEGDEEVLVGEEYSYNIVYKNLSKVVIKNVNLEIKYPENFVVLDGTPGSDNFRKWHFDEIPQNFTGKVTVKGKLIAPTSYTGILLADLIYTPANFSSDFKKESSFVTTVLDTGISFNIDFISSVMMGEDNDIAIKFKEKDESYLKNFRITVEPIENVDFINYEVKEDALYSIVRPGVFDVAEIKDGEGEVILKVKFREKLNDKEELVINFSQADSAGNFKTFETQKVSIDVIKSDLSLTLIVNAKKNDQGVAFSDELNYSIVYSNKGDSEMSDVIVMAVLESEFLNWNSLVDPNKGDISGNTITWTKDDIPALANLKVRDEGYIDFSINLVNKPNEIFPEKNYSVQSYAQYRVGSSTADAFKSESNKSNIILNKISSNLSIDEQLRYFNDDNISVGSGPFPPRVGQKTEYKIYWELSNNLHELSNVSVSLNLPSYVTYESKEKTSAGSLLFTESDNSLKWEVGKMPVTVQKVTAEFSISVEPTEDFLNKIMILSPGPKVFAHDVEADIDLSQTGTAKTTKLEDDPIAKSDGIISN